MKKKIILYLILVCVVIGGVFLWIEKNKNQKENDGNNNGVVVKETASFCYYYFNKTDHGLYDQALLRLNINGENVSGEFDNYPAGKDSKVGTFEGTVGPLNQETTGRTASLWWNSLTRGRQVKEELNIEFGDSNASALYGEMIDRGDGVYVYKDKTQMFFGPSLSQISCESPEFK